MKTVITILQMLVRLCFVVLLVLGITFWTGRGLSLIPLHMGVGYLLVLSLWLTSMIAGYRARSHRAGHRGPDMGTDRRRNRGDADDAITRILPLGRSSDTSARRHGSHRATNAWRASRRSASPAARQAAKLEASAVLCCDAHQRIASACPRTIEEAFIRAGGPQVMLLTRFTRASAAILVALILGYAFVLTHSPLGAKSPSPAAYGVALRP